MKIIIYVNHNRHTDDKFKVFPYSDENLDKVKTLCQNDWNKCGEELNYYGDYCYGLSDDYYSYLVITEMEK